MNKKEAIERVERLCAISVPFYASMMLNEDEEKYGDFALVKYLKENLPND